MVAFEEKAARDTLATKVDSCWCSVNTSIDGNKGTSRVRESTHISLRLMVVNMNIPNST